MLKDLRYAGRALRHNPGFAVTAIVSIALAIGATSSIFTFADGILLRPLPVPDASKVVTLSSRTPNGTFGGLSWPDYLSFRDHNRSFSGLVAYQPLAFGVTKDSHSQAELRAGVAVSGNFFQVLEIAPRIGRAFASGERTAVVVLSDAAWSRDFNRESSALGRQVRLNGTDFIIIGVAPGTFTGMDQYEQPDFYVPALASRTLQETRSARVFTVKGRLRPGVSTQSASADVAALAAALEQAHPDTNRAIGATVRTELQTRLDVSPGTTMVLALLFGVVLIVLAIACANVANLMLSRGRARTREMAVRLAIGASRVQLVRQLMAESLLIALAGGGLGLLVATLFSAFASTIDLPGDIPVHFSFHLDARAIGFTALVSIASAILFGLVPALQSTRTDLVSSLKTGEADQKRRRLFGRSTLVVAQVAGSLLLLLVATQLVRGFGNALKESPGFRRDRVLMMSFDPAIGGYNAAQAAAFYARLTERTGALPGVASVALATAVPMSTNPRMEAVVPEGYSFPRGQESTGVWRDAVDPLFFDCLGISMTAGRSLRVTDRAGSPLVGVVSETFARRYLAGNAIGKRLRLGGAEGPWIEVVGVTAPGHYFTGTTLEPPTEALFLPLSQHPESKLTLFVQARRGDASALASPLRDAVRLLDPNLPIFGVSTLNDYFVRRSVNQFNLITGAVGTIGLIGLLLALVGLYAVVSGQVAGRTREIGLRMALGADRYGVIRMILKDAGGMTLAGLGFGLAAGIAIGRVLSSALRVPMDASNVAWITAALLMTTLVAAAIPARRASQVDPISALRQD